MKRSISCNSFFFDGNTRPLINSYGKFLKYLSIHGINISKKTRQMALFIYFNRLKTYNTQVIQTYRIFEYLQYHT